MFHYLNTCISATLTQPLMFISMCLYVCLDWYGALWHCCWDSWLHFSRGFNVSRRDWLLRPRVWLVVCWCFHLWASSGWVVLILYASLVITFQCFQHLMHSSFCQSGQVTHHFILSLWWAHMERSWITRTA